MKNWLILLLVLLAAAACTHAAVPEGVQAPFDGPPPLDVVVKRFDLTDAIMRGGISELSLQGIRDMHLGFEEIIRNRIQDDPRVQSPHFSLHLMGRTVREILDALCNSDLPQISVPQVMKARVG